MAMSSVDLSVLTFALSSWLDGSAQLRRSLIFLPLGIGGHHEAVSASNSARRGHAGVNGATGRDNRTFSRGRLVDWFASWLQRPERDLDETEKSLMGVLDVSSAIVLLRFLGTSPVLPFILNPLTVVLPLPRNLKVGSIRWTRVVLTSLLFSCLHEAQRTSVSAICSYLKKRKLHRQKKDLQNIIISGDERRLRVPSSTDPRARDTPSNDEDFSDEDDECLICAAGGSDQSMAESVSSLASMANVSLGELEAFCINAPQKHLMHRKCFLEWKEAYKEQRAHQPQPTVTLLCEDRSLPVPGSALWMRARAILAAAGLVRVEDIHSLPPRADMWMQSLRTDENQDGESVLTLLNNERRDRRLSLSHAIAYSRPRATSISSPSSTTCLTSSSSDIHLSTTDRHPNPVLATLVTKWPPCPGCRSAVKMNFVHAPAPVLPTPSPKEASPITKYMNYAKGSWKIWALAWRQLVTGRTILMKTMTQVMFAVFLLSMMRVKKSRGGRERGSLIARLT